MSQQINLLNPAFRKQKSHFTLLTMLQGLALIMAGSLLMYAYAVYQVSVMEKLSAESNKRLVMEQARLATHSAGYSPAQANQLLENELQQLEKKSDEATDLLEALRSGTVGNTTGFSEYMRALSRQVVPGLWLTNFKMTGNAISLSGGVIAPELVPNYIQKLGRETAMQGKNFSNLEIKASKDTKYLEFTLYSTHDEEVQP